MAPLVTAFNQVHWMTAKTCAMVAKTTRSMLVMLPESLVVLSGVMQLMSVVGLCLHEAGIRPPDTAHHFTFF